MRRLGRHLVEGVVEDGGDVGVVAAHADTIFIRWTSSVIFPLLKNLVVPDLAVHWVRRGFKENRLDGAFDEVDLVVGLGKLLQRVQRRRSGRSCQESDQTATIGGGDDEAVEEPGGEQHPPLSLWRLLHPLVDQAARDGEDDPLETFQRTIVEPTSGRRCPAGSG